jgi:hypothetical protein
MKRKFLRWVFVYDPLNPPLPLTNGRKTLPHGRISFRHGRKCSVTEGKCSVASKPFRSAALLYLVETVCCPSIDLIFLFLVNPWFGIQCKGRLGLQVWSSQLLPLGIRDVFVGVCKFSRPQAVVFLTPVVF